MKLAVSAAAVAVALLAPVAPASAATAAPALTPAPAGFDAVTTLPFTGTSLASPADGVAYVAGSDASGATRVRRYTRTTTGTTATDVALAATGGGALTSGGGRTYLLTAGSTPSLWELTGTTATRLQLPTVDPSTGGTVDPASIAADTDGSLFVAYNRRIGPPNQGPGRTAAHLAGGTWTWAPVLPYANEGAADSYAYRGTYFQVVAGNLSEALTSWSGDAWASHGLRSSCKSAWCFADEDFTFTSTTDLHGWGWRSPENAATPGLDPAEGVCSHLVGNQVSACPAPRWPVTEAERRADGSVVLAGSDRVGPDVVGAAPGAFAVVPTPGAEPVALRGDAYDATLDLAAAPTGSTVWSLNRSGTSTVLQVMGTTTPGTGYLPKPRPARRHLPHHR